MPAIRNHVLSLHASAPQLTNITHLVSAPRHELAVTHRSDEDWSMSSASVHEVPSAHSRSSSPTPSTPRASSPARSATRNSAPSSSSGSRRSVMSPVHTSAQSPSRSISISPKEDQNAAILRALAELRDQVASMSKNNARNTSDNGRDRRLWVHHDLLHSQGTSFLQKRFSWVRDEAFLRLARAGQLAPCDLIKLVPSQADDVLSPDGSSSTTRNHRSLVWGMSTRSSAKLFVEFFTSIPILASAWAAYGDCLCDGACNATSRGSILAAMSTYLRYLVNWTSTHTWSACMSFHHQLQLDRKCAGPFNPSLWVESVDDKLENLYFNVHTEIADASSNLASNSATAASQAIVKDTGDEHEVKSGKDTSSSAHILRRRLAKVHGVCRPWNEGGCGQTCLHGFKHKCWSCGGDHTGRKCPVPFP